MKGDLTDKERKIADHEYEKHKYDNICPHTTNPLQLKSLCRRCVMLDKLGISVYQMPRPWGDWACRCSYSGLIADGFTSRINAERGAIKSCGLPVIMTDDEKTDELRERIARRFGHKTLGGK